VALAVLLFGVLRPSARTAGTSSTAPQGTIPAAADGGSPLVTVGSVAPDFTLANLESGSGGTMPGAPPVHLAALGADVHRPVVLNFFASYCVPCEQETPLMARTATRLAADGSPVQFVGVDVADNTSDGRDFVTHAGVTYPVGADPDLAVSSAKYALVGLPETFFIGPDGRVEGRILGAVTATELDQWVTRLST